MAADPMYRQIADDLRRQIESGDLPRGSQLPTELELSEKYDASRNTVRDAVKWLITRGLVETRPGQGTFVVNKIIPFVTTLTGDAQTGFGGGEGDIYCMEVKTTARVPTASLPRVELQQAAGTVATDLQVEENSPIVSRHQQRFIDGTPWSLQTSFYPMRLVEQGAFRLIQATNIEGGTVAYLAETLQAEQVGWRDMIRVRAPDQVESTFFGLPDDGRVSVIETRRTAFDGDGNAVRLTISAYPADRNQFAVNVGNVPPDLTDPTAPGPQISADTALPDGGQALGR
jgi:GntR family transcriptional regulator